MLSCTDLGKRPILIHISSLLKSVLWHSPCFRIVTVSVYVKNDISPQWQATVGIIFNLNIWLNSIPYGKWNILGDHIKKTAHTEIQLLLLLMKFQLIITNSTCSTIELKLYWRVINTSMAEQTSRIEIEYLCWIITNKPCYYKQTNVNSKTMLHRYMEN